MKVNIVTLLISSAVLMAAWWVRQTIFTGSSVYGRYYLSAVLMISGILAVISLLRLITSHRNPPMSVDADGGVSSDQHRQHYRIRYLDVLRPIFVQKTDDRPSAQAYTCPVYDVSESGISLDCTGMYKPGEAVQGGIIFGSGRMTPINGIVIREVENRTCIRLHGTIAPALLMQEQREWIAIDKASGPKPAVSRILLDGRAGVLPSHDPKGICRLKRT